MGQISDLERRIEQLRACASSGRLPEELVTDIESLLSEGYLVALQADARSARLREQSDALAGDVSHPRVAEEIGRLVRERRKIEQSARRLRERLAQLHLLATRVVDPRSGSA